MPSNIVITGAPAVTTSVVPNPSLEVRSFSDMKLRWELPETLMGGTLAMRAAAQKYLPQDDKESTPAYTARLHKSFLLNAFRKTVYSMTGKVFSKPVLMQEQAPAWAKEFIDDVDKEGRNINQFAYEVFRTSVQYGLSHIFIDMPKSSKANPTLADDIAENRRPYWVHVKPRQLIGWRSIRVGSQEVLTSIRMLEVTMEDDGDYGEREVTRVREVTLTSYTLWEADTQGNWTVKEQGPMTLGMIPLVTVYTNRQGFMIAAPPLEDLAWMNVAHWQSNSDQRNILHVARVPILFGAGLGEDGDNLVIGPNRLVNAPAEAKLSYVEHTGAAIEAGAKDLEMLQDHMRIMGLELLMPLAGAGVTATAKSLDYADANSPLQFMALSLQDSLNMALWMTAKWSRQQDTGLKTKVNTDFGITLRDAADVQGLIQARIAGEISSETFWEELKRRGILREDFDATKEKELLRAESEEDMKRALETMTSRVPGAAPGGTPGVGSDVQ